MSDKIKVLNKRFFFKAGEILSIENGIVSSETNPNLIISLEALIQSGVKFIEHIDKDTKLKDSYESIPIAMSHIRRIEGLTQEGFSNKIGMSRSSVVGIERGNQSMGFESFAIKMRKLGYKVSLKIEKI